MKKITKVALFLIIISLFSLSKIANAAGALTILSVTNPAIMTGSGSGTGTTGYVPLGVYTVNMFNSFNFNEVPTVYINGDPQETISFVPQSTRVSFVITSPYPKNTPIAIEVRTSAGRISTNTYQSQMGTQDTQLYGCVNQGNVDPQIFKTGTNTPVGKCPPGANAPLTRGTNVTFYGNGFNPMTMEGDVSIKVQNVSFPIVSVGYNDNHQWEIVAKVPYNVVPFDQILIKVNGITFSALLSFDGPITTLAAAPVAVNTGGTVTVNFANITTPTTLDWIGLYSPISKTNGEYDPSNWKYANSCTTTPGASGLSSGSCTFVMPNVAGDYQFRLLANNGTSTVIISSNTVSVVAPTISAVQSNVNTGATVTVNFGNVISITPMDWIGVYSGANAPDDAYSPDWKYTSSCSKTPNNAGLANRSCTFVMPNTPGEYQFRLFANNGSTKLATSNIVTVTVPTLTVSSNAVHTGDSVTVTFNNVAMPTILDWIGLYSPIGAANSAYDSSNWKYANSCTTTPGASGLSSGSCIFTMPNVAGDYQFRLLANNGTGTVIVSSNTVTVTTP